MDTVAPGSKRDALRQRVEEAKAALLEAASTAVIKNDPLCQHLNALSLSVGAHYDIYCATEEAQQNVAKNVRLHADALTGGVLATVRESLTSLTKELGPQLLKSALPTMLQALRFIKLWRALWLLLTAAAVLAAVWVFAFAAGMNQGRLQGEQAGQTIHDATKAGPDAALDWAMLMANNDPGPELAECKKSISTDEYGRRSCPLPVWLDPAQTGHP